jgi:hypothetical protein
VLVASSSDPEAWASNGLQDALLANAIRETEAEYQQAEEEAEPSMIARRSSPPTEL